MAGITMIRRASALRRALQGAQGLGFVPTMGALHAGHLSLVQWAKAECGKVVVSIFVNPLQFGPGEDFRSYPRNLRRDCRMLMPFAPLLLFAPPAREVYAKNFATRVTVGGEVGRVLEARCRPGHFQGVATVVARLFGLVGPCRAYFGLKDYQQCLVLRRMVQDLALPVELCFLPTLREPDGLAISSRNAYLSRAERAHAPALYRALQIAAKALERGVPPRRAEALAKQELKGFRLQYLKVADARTLGDPSPGGRCVVLAAAFLGKTRLIDNVMVKK